MAPYKFQMYAELIRSIGGFEEAEIEHMTRNEFVDPPCIERELRGDTPVFRLSPGFPVERARVALRFLLELE